VVVEPVVNREKLRELLALEAEYPTLDFKSSCDLNDKHDQVELAKDVGAMSVRGGFLVIGVDDRGRLTGDLTAEQANLFDEARLRPKLLKWLPDTLAICSQTHEIDGHRVVLLHVSPNPAGCAFFRGVGQFGQQGKTARVVFREGEVFFRDGTRSSRLNQRGLEQVIRQQVERERRRWEADHAAEYRRLAEELRAGAAGQQVARGSAIEFNLALESEVLTEAAVELLRTDDDIPMRRMLTRAVPEARALYRARDQDGLSRMLDRLTCLAATFLDLERYEWFERVVKTLVLIYGIGFENQPPIIGNPPPEAAALWLTIIERVVAVGALAVRREDWRAVRYLASRRHPGMHKHYATWIRHALTMAARAGILTQRQDTPEILDSLLSISREIVRRLDCLRPDIEAEDDAVLNGLTQFDFLACLVAMADSNNTDSSGAFYPNFARFDETRTQPAAQRLLHDPEIRKAIYPANNESLASALHTIDRTAQREGFRYDGWGGYTPDVSNFIEEHSANRNQR
jgi:Schlafen, AlbA_2